jgi:(+)-pinoresinol hydroxylase
MSRAVAVAAVACAVAAAVPFAARAQDAPFPIAAWSRTAAGAEDRGTPPERGAAVFNNWCSACHSRGPQNAPGTTSLQNKYRGSVPAALEDRTDLTAELVKFFVRNGVATMPQFRKTELSDADVDALAAYLTKR